MRYKVTHTTDYVYQDSVSLSYNEARLLPVSTRYQTCFKRQLKITPEPVYYREYHDYFGNQASHFCIDEPHQQMTVITSSEIDVLVREMPDLASAMPWEKVLLQMKQDTSQRLFAAREFCFDSPLITVTPEIRDYARVSFLPGRPFLEAVYDLMHRIYTEFSYDPSFTNVTTPLHEVLLHKRGVCQDFAHIAIACVRSMGLPAAYISGYLETLPPPGKPKLVGSDASHAWFSVYDPDSGWVEFDPTNDQIPLKQYINVAYGRDYQDVTPLKGVLFGGGSNQLSVSVDVMPMVTPAKIAVADPELSVQAQQSQQQ